MSQAESPVYWFFHCSLHSLNNDVHSGSLRVSRGEKEEKLFCNPVFSLIFVFFYFFVDKHAALFTCVVSTGIVYVAGISYSNIRSNKNERAMRIGMCHAWKLVGVALAFTMYAITSNSDANDEDALGTFYKLLGYLMIGSSGLFTVLLAINEFLQRQGLMYNYRDCLDHDNSIANNYCKLFSKHEVIIEPNRSAHGSWKSTENLMFGSRANFSHLWTFYLMIPKLLGVIIFHFYLFKTTLTFSVEYIDNAWISLVNVWLMAGGSFIGMILLRFFNGGKVYTTTSVFSVAALATSYILVKQNRDEAAIGLWCFYCLSSMSIAVPDNSLMEISKIKFNEFAYTIGLFIELVPIAILQFLQKKTFLDSFNERNFFVTIIVSMFVLLVTSLVYQLHMPNTLGKSLLQIQNELLKFNNYFVFNFDSKIAARSSKRTSNGSQYYHSNNVNVFEHSQNTTVYSSIGDNQSSQYYEIDDKLPDPPVNKSVNFDYNSEILRPQPIIPRVNLAAKSSHLTNSKSWNVYKSRRILFFST